MRDDNDPVIRDLVRQVDTVIAYGTEESLIKETTDGDSGSPDGGSSGEPLKDEA